MNRIIAIEGIDGSGKTTLARKLSDFYSIPIYFCDDEIRYQKMTKEWSTGITDLAILDFLTKSYDTKVILDRTLPSNFVYKKKYDEWILKKWEEYSRIISMKFVYLNGASITNRQEAKFRKYSKFCIGDESEILRRYEISLSKISGKYLRIDTSTNGIEETFCLAKEFIERE